MEPYNLFNNIHKGLKAMLYQTAALLQQTDFKNEEDTSSSLENISKAVDLFNKYAGSEMPMIAAAIYKSEPAFVVAMGEAEMERVVITQQIKATSAKLSNAFLNNDNDANSAVLQQLFSAFMLAALRCMALEEDVVNAVLRSHYSDAALHTISQQLLASLPAESSTESNRWMFRGLNNDEICNWLKEIKNSAPDDVFTSLVDMAAEELNEHRWLVIQEAITDGAQLA